MWVMVSMCLQGRQNRSCGQKCSLPRAGAPYCRVATVVLRELHARLTILAGYAIQATPVNSLGYGDGLAPSSCSSMLRSFTA